MLCPISTHHARGRADALITQLEKMSSKPYLTPYTETEANRTPGLQLTRETMEHLEENEALWILR